MATEITIDQWNPSNKRWRFETHCYGPKGCPRHKAGPPRRVQGRKPYMVWVDDDVETVPDLTTYLAAKGDGGGSPKAPQA